jgi:Flp pilus assembly protein TadD
MILLAGGFVLTVCAMQAQTAQRQRVTSPGGLTSGDAAKTRQDEAKIRQDEARLTRILESNPDDAGALAGMGWVRSRQRNYTAAVSYLERAVRHRPGDAKLKFALDEARFRVMLVEAEHARAAGDAETARKFYAAALGVRPGSREAAEGMRAVAAGVERTAGGVQ